MRTAAATILAGSLLGCGGGGGNPVECLDSANCNLYPGGVCATNGATGSQWCQYPDDQCPSGMRWSDFGTGDGVGGECVPETPLPDAGNNSYTPTLRTPMNASRVGSMFLADTRRPVFRWEPPETTGTYTYTVEFSTDGTFASGVSSAETGATTFQPIEDLAGSAVPPVGARYYWRVTACEDTNCGTTEPWWFDLGRFRADINGDGYDDAVVGAPLDDQGELDAGAIHVFLGGAGADFDETRDGKVNSPQDSEQMGTALALADLNGDGFAEIIASGHLYLNERGRVRIYPGSASAPATFAAPTVLLGAEVEISFGKAFASGDFNCDGFGDLAIGQAGPGASIDQTGRVFVYFGGAGAFDITPDGTLNGISVGDGFGEAIAAADINADGCDDLIAGLGDRASVNVYHGASGATFDEIPDVSFAETSVQGFGAAVAAGADVNGDGIPDVLVGAASSDRAYLYFGARTPDTTYDALLNGGAGSAFGTSVSVGDFNADGFGEYLVGAPSDGTTGRVYVFLGAESPSTTPLTSMGGTGQAGFRLSRAADFNADGIEDYLVGNGLGRAVQVYLGGSPSDGADAALAGLTGDNFGMAIGP